MRGVRSAEEQPEARRADRKSAKGRIAPRMARPAGPSAAGSDEGTARSVARRPPDAGIVKGRASAP